MTREENLQIAWATLSLYYAERDRGIQHTLEWERKMRPLEQLMVDNFFMPPSMARLL